MSAGGGRGQLPALLSLDMQPSNLWEHHHPQHVCAGWGGRQLRVLLSVDLRGELEHPDDLHARAWAHQLPAPRHAGGGV